MFIKENESLPPNIIWMKGNLAKKILNSFPEIARRIKRGYIEIGFADSKMLRDEINRLKEN